MNFHLRQSQKWLFTLIYCWIGINLLSEAQTATDSLLSIVSTDSRSDASIDALHELAWIYRKKDPEKAIEYAMQSVNDARLIHDKRRESIGYVRLAEVERLRRNYEEAMAFFEQSLLLEQETEHTYGIARANYGTTLCLRQLNRLTEANTSIDQAIASLSSASKLPRDHQVLLARSFHQLALIKEKLAAYEDAIDALTRKIEIAEALEDIGLQATTRSFLGGIYRKHGSLDLAEAAFKNLVVLWDSLKNPNQTARAHTDLAAVYYDQQNYEDALEQTRKSMALCEQYNLNLTLAGNYNNLGLIAKAKGDLKTAITYISKSVSIKEGLNENRDLYLNHYNLGNSFKQLKSADSALFHYKRSLQLNQRNISMKMETYWNLSEIFLLQNLPDSASKYQKRYGALKDSTDLLLAESNRVKDNFQQALKEKELLERDNQIQRVSLEKQNQMISGLIIILFLIIGIGFLYFRSYRLKQRSFLAEKEAEIKDKEIEDLLNTHEIKLLDEREEERTRIARDLHDRLGGTLSVVKMHMKSVEDILVKGDSKSLESYQKASLLLDDACEEVRQVAHDLESGVLKNFGLVSALKSLRKTVNATGQLRLEVINFGFEDEHEPARLKSTIERPVYRIIQELLSNVLKHADAKEMTVQLLKKNNNLNVVVEDDGIGFDPSKTKKEGLGLRSIQSRIEKLNGFINLDSGKGSGTTITIDIPLQS